MDAPFKETPLRKALFTFLLILRNLTPAFAQSAPLEKALEQNRYQLVIDQGRLSGPGAQVLQQAIGEAHFLLIGEDHGTAEIPLFVSSLCDVAVPKGFHTMAIETGALATQQLQRWLEQKDGKYTQVAEFEKNYPLSLAFYNMRQEYDMLHHCSADASPAKFKLWGLDQEFVGSPKLILDNILKTNPGAAAAAQVRSLLHKNDEAYAKALQSGNFSDLFIEKVSEKDLEELNRLLVTQGNAESRELAHELLQTSVIYQLFSKGLGGESNRKRSLAMKERFSRNYVQSAKGGPAPKVILKFGAFHMFKGFNPLLNNDLGNYVTELADGLGLKSIHILVLGVEGTKLEVEKVSTSEQIAPFDLKSGDYHLGFRPMLNLVLDQGWTLFDLRGLRKDFKSSDVERDIERLTFGYDFLLLIPRVAAASQIR